MLPTVKITRGNVNDQAFRNQHHLFLVSMLAMATRSLLLFANKKNGSFPKNLEKMKVAVETWDTKGADNFDSRNKKPLYKR